MITKYFIIKDVEERFKEYNNLTNYYAQIRTIKDMRLIEEIEIWYTDTSVKNYSLF